MAKQESLRTSECPVARTLESQKSGSNDHIIALMTAYDPCVNYRIENQRQRAEVMHA